MVLLSIKPLIILFTSYTRCIHCVLLSNGIICVLQSAIGEGMTRRDHSDVSNQVYINKNILSRLCLFFHISAQYAF